MSRLAPWLSGALLAVSALVPGAWPLVFVALIPWLALGRLGRFREGYAFGLAFCLPMTYWLGQFVTRWTGSVPVGLLAWLPAGLAMAAYFGLFSWLTSKAPLWAWPLLWAGVEVFRSYIPVFAFPWGLLAHPLADVPLLALAPARLGTEYLVGALIFGLSLFIVRMFAPGKRPTATPLVVGAMAWGGVTVVSLVDWSGPLDRVTAVQPGIDMAYGGFDPDAAIIASRPLVDAAAWQGSALIVLPEGIAGRSGGPGLFRPPVPPGKTEPTVVYGGQRGSSPSFQTAYLTNGEFTDSFDKTRLVIFGEFVPGRSVIPYPDSFRLPGGDLAAGTESPRPLAAPPGTSRRVGPILCFEALFPDIAWRMTYGGATELAVMSIDDWFAGTAAPRVLAQASSWRAMENGRTVIRAATTGQTAIYGFDGGIDARVEGPGPGTASGLRRTGFFFPYLPLFPAVAFMVTVATVFRRRVGSGDAAVKTTSVSSGGVDGDDLGPG